MSFALDGNAIERAASEIGHALGIGRERAKSVIASVVEETKRNHFLRRLSGSRSVAQMTSAIDEASPEDLEFSPGFRNRVARTIGGMAIGNWIALVGIALGAIIAIEVSVAVGVFVCLVMLAIAARQMGTSLWGLVKEMLDSIEAKITSAFST